MDENKKAQNKIASWASMVFRDNEKSVWHVNQDFFEGEASFRASENYTMKVHFESH